MDLLKTCRIEHKVIEQKQRDPRSNTFVNLLRRVDHEVFVGTSLLYRRLYNHIRLRLNSVIENFADDHEETESAQADQPKVRSLLIHHYVSEVVLDSRHGRGVANKEHEVASVAMKLPDACYALSCLPRLSIFELHQAGCQ